MRRLGRPVVVGFDGSAEAAAAVALAVREASYRHVTLRVVTAYTNDWTDDGVNENDWQQRVRRDTEDAQAAAVAAAAQSKAAPTAVDYVATSGNPGEVLVEQSAHADLLVLGSRNGGPLERALLGSVCHYCLRHAHCPVLVVPAQRKGPGVDRVPAQLVDRS